MAVPLMRSYTTDGSALNVFGLATDDITGLTITQLNRSNVVLDSRFKSTAHRVVKHMKIDC